MMPPTLGARSQQEKRRDYDAERRKAKPWRSFYSTAAWRARRAQQLNLQPLCERCLREDQITAATVADHKTPHRGDWDLFIGGPLESMCKRHHDGAKQREERGAAR